MLKEWRMAYGNAVCRMDEPGIRKPFSDGPGLHTDDGCPVEVYRLLPDLGEAELITSYLGGPSQILELGCAAGRMTRGLTRLKHDVVAVDHSQAMLSYVSDARVVCSKIEYLNLGQRFPVVLLASGFINEVEDDLRRAFIETCRRHVTDDGVVIVERHSPESLRQATAGATTVEGNGLTVLFEEVTLHEPYLSATLRHRFGEREWSESFTVRILDDRDVKQILTNANLQFDRWIDPRNRWAVARPI
jgi:SAM-dependent methyltransferase